MFDYEKDKMKQCKELIDNAIEHCHLINASTLDIMYYLMARSFDFALIECQQGNLKHMINKLMNDYKFKNKGE